MLELLAFVAGLVVVWWLVRATLRWVRYDQAAKIVEYWRQNGIS